MSATTTQPATGTESTPNASEVTPEVKALLAKRDAIIELAQTEVTNIEDAKAKNDAKARLSAGGRLANRVREIREVEADLEIEGHSVDPWMKPTTTRSRQTDLSQETIETNLTQLWETYQRVADKPTVRTTLDQRIQALLKAAASRGYTVKDPRPKKASK